MTNEVIIPSSPEDLKALKGVATEIADSLTRMDSEREFIKEAVEEASETYGLPKGMIKKMAVQYHKNSFDKVVSESEDFQELYEKVFVTNGE